MKNKNNRLAFFAAIGCLTVGSMMFTGCSDDVTTGVTTHNGGTQVPLRVSFCMADAKAPRTRAAAEENRIMHVTASNGKKFTIEETTVYPGDLPAQTRDHVFQYNYAKRHPNGNEMNPTMAESWNRVDSARMVNHFFSVSAKRAKEAAQLDYNMNWVHNAKVNGNGQFLAIKKPYKIGFDTWNTNLPYAYFYAIYPFVDDHKDAITNLTPANSSAAQSFDFINPKHNKDQFDLLAGGSEGVEQFTEESKEDYLDCIDFAATTPIVMGHLLTAVKFAVGPGMPQDMVVDRIELRDAMSKGHVTLPVMRKDVFPNHYGSQKGRDFDWIERPKVADHFNAMNWWSNLSDPATFVLDGINISTKQEIDSVFICKDGVYETTKGPVYNGDHETLCFTPGDGYTFFMIPQSLNYKVYLYMHFRSV